MIGSTRRAVLALPLLAPVAAQAFEPPPGSPLRREVLDALRPLTERELAPPIQYIVKGMNIDGDAAFVRATPQRLNGQKIDWHEFPFGRTIEAGGMSDEIMALLKFEGGVWRVKEYSFGATDVPWADWPRKHRIPDRLILDAFR